MTLNNDAAQAVGQVGTAEVGQGVDGPPGGVIPSEKWTPPLHYRVPATVRH